jgi:hypothetical protein
MRKQAWYIAIRKYRNGKCNPIPYYGFDFRRKDIKAKMPNNACGTIQIIKVYIEPANKEPRE